VSDYLKNKIGVNTKDRVDIVERIFGDNRILKFVSRRTTRVFLYTIDVTKKHPRLKVLSIPTLGLSLFFTNISKSFI
jgi:hypothetical protein